MLVSESLETAEGNASHAVQFYENEESLAQLIADFIADGFVVNESVIVIATPTHRQQVISLLHQRGIAIDEAMVAGRAIVLDAEETLATFMDGRSPSWERFHRTIIGAFDAVTGGDPTRRVRAYGEMVDVLWRAGNADGAIQLEEMWNRIAQERTFTLLCAYVMASFHQDSTGLRRVCLTHDHVAHAQRPDLAPADARTARALVAEIAHRTEVEKALRTSLRDLAARDRVREAVHRRNQRLQHVTAAIASAVTRDEVLETIVDRIATTLGASSVVLFLLDKERNQARLARHVGISPEHAERFASVELGTMIAPVFEPLTTGAPVWLDDQIELVARYPDMADVVRKGVHSRFACLPLVAHGVVIGSMGLTFDDAPRLDDDERDFLQLVARYSALALERVHAQEAERQSRKRAELLYDLAGAVIVANNVDEVFDAALEAIAQALSADRSAILTYGHDPVMRFRAWRGLSDAYRAAVDGHSPWTRDTRDPRPIVVADVETDTRMAAYREIFRAEGIGALAFVPLVTGQKLLGKFMLYYPQPRELQSSEIELAQAIADHVAAALARFTAVAELQQTVRFNEVFTGILGHDLRNPLGAIVTAAQLAMMRNPSDKLNKPLSRILSSSARMARMIEQLLDFTNVRLGGGMPLNCQPIDLVPIVRHVVDELDDAHPAWQLSLDHTGNTNGAWDGDRLAQVFSNLIANALQHGEVSGGVRVRLDGSRPDQLRAEIENSGAIPVEMRDILFEPLAGGRSRRTGSRGLGLGLFISREIVRGHGGAIAVDFGDGERTKFVITLPRPTS
jgi:signal transduction histidine kinase